jgi:hypothetical protein
MLMTPEGDGANRRRFLWHFPLQTPLAADFNLFVSLFSVSASIRNKIKSQGVYLGILRSSGVRSRQEGGKRIHRALDGPHHAPYGCPCVVCPILVLCVSCLHSPKNDPQETLGPYDVWKVSKTQKY